MWAAMMQVEIGIIKTEARHGKSEAKLLLSKSIWTTVIVVIAKKEKRVGSLGEPVFS